MPLFVAAQTAVYVFRRLDRARMGTMKHVYAALITMKGKTMTEFASEVEERLSEAGEKVRKQSDETLHTVDAFVRENPWISLGLAFAAGTLLSALKRRS